MCDMSGPSASLMLLIGLQPQKQHTASRHIPSHAGLCGEPFMHLSLTLPLHACHAAAAFVRHQQKAAAGTVDSDTFDH